MNGENSMADLQKFIDRVRWLCAYGNLGYDQWNRWDVREGGEADCSSLIIVVLRECGFDTGGATYTGNMASELCKHGWRELPNNGYPQPGDILLNHRNHVALLVDWGILAQASIDENGDIAGGESGDQTDRETVVKPYYDYPWDCYLRYEGATSHEGGYTDCRAVQAAVRADVDNVWGPDTEKRVDAVRKASNWGGVQFPYGVEFTQSVVGTEVDGIWGDNSMSAHDNCVQLIQEAVGANVDGIWGPETERLVRAVEAGAEKP
jgi:hypothetical protein